MAVPAKILFGTEQEAHAMDPNAERMLWMYEKMVEIREYEETMAAVYL